MGYASTTIRVSTKNMNKSKAKQSNRLTRHRRVRAKIKGTAKRPRVTVFKSSNNLFVQFIDDEKNKTILSNSLKDKKAKKLKKVDSAKGIGEVLAAKAKASGISEVVFDRGGYKYHGRVKALAEGLRAGGLKL